MNDETQACGARDPAAMADRHGSEARLRRATSPALRDQLGQVFTPPALAEAMARWIAPIVPRRILDPAVGPGALPAACAAIGVQGTVVGYDIDARALALAERRLSGTGLTLVPRHADAGRAPLDASGTFDAVIANPPFRRREAGDGAGASGADAAAERLGVPLGPRANLYLVIGLAALAALRPGGRAALLWPSSALDVDGSRAARAWMARAGWLRRIALVDHRNGIFPNASVGACLLCLERPDGRAVPEGIEIADLEARDLRPRRTLSRRALAERPRWSGALGSREGPASVPASARCVIGGAADAPAGWVPLAYMASVRRGLATGANAYFLVTASRARHWRLPRAALRPFIGRVRDAPGALLTAADLAALDRQDRPIWLFAPHPPLDAACDAYLRHGEAQGIARRALARRRARWYACEAQEPAPIWVGTFSRTGLRAVRNRAGIGHLTAFHGLYPTRRDETFLLALTALLRSPQVGRIARQRMRVQGRGLAKLEPSDLAGLPVPDLTRLAPALLADLAGAAIAGAEAIAFATEAALDALAALEVGDATGARARPVHIGSPDAP